MKFFLKINQKLHHQQGQLPHHHGQNGDVIRGNFPCRQRASCHAVNPTTWVTSTRSANGKLPPKQFMWPCYHADKGAKGILAKDLKIEESRLQPLHQGWSYKYNYVFCFYSFFSCFSIPTLANFGGH